MSTTPSPSIGAACRRLAAGVCGLLVALLASSLNPAGAQGHANASASIAEQEAKVKELGGQRFGGKTIAEIAEMKQKAQDDFFDKLDDKTEIKVHTALVIYSRTAMLAMDESIAKKNAALDESKEMIARLDAELEVSTNQLVANWEPVLRHDPSARPSKELLAHVKKLLSHPDLVSLEAKSRLRSTFGRYLGP